METINTNLSESESMANGARMTDMEKSTISGGSRRRSGWARAGGALAVLCLLVWSGCKNPLNVQNPNKLTEQNVDSPEAYGALVGASRNNLARAANGMLAIMENASDESFWIGSRDAWGALDNGKISDPTNEFTDVTWPFVGQARFTADKAIIQGKVFQDAGTLPDPNLLAQAYLYGGTLYTLIADTWQRYVLPSDLTDPEEAGNPIAAADMPGLYDTAIGYFTAGLQVVTDDDTELALRAMRVRAMQAKAIRLQIQSGDPTNPGVVSVPQQAVQDANAILNQVSDGWTFSLDFSDGLLGIGCESWAPQVWSRGELQVGDRPAPDNRYVVLSNEDKTIDAVKIEDPIDSIVDPAYSAQLAAFKAGGRDASMTEMSAAELHLILAENELATNGDTQAFRDQINAVRALHASDGLTDYTGQIPAMQILEWERNVNLTFQGRRLADHYRFGSQDPLWQPTSVAVESPGTLFPITITEIRSNPNVSG
ncbi:MAG TPA: RagB/SusD family nutrient uptake outer membrane protein [Gemmatimonadota bacterium]|nr:RagB/SusD family nutrient uptake outer membrane protein [Gemmatimonadota bacterium]